jgi:tetratricopeptide (TPR) repeat protein
LFSFALFSKPLARLLKHSRKKAGDLSPTGASSKTPPGTPAEPSLAPRKLWLFRLTALVLLPLVLFGLLEAGLRVAGYGHNTAFFKRQKIGTEDVLVENDSFGLRFFPPALARSPAPIVFKPKKVPGTFRIFLFGESAALGDPRPAYGAGRYLQVLLRDRYPDRRFEVICVAMTAINSHVILPIARECARYDGDLWIVYMGNNELVGPFGATTVFGSQSPPAFYVRIALAVQCTRVGQLLASLAGKINGSSRASNWGGMRMFMNNLVPPDDLHRARVNRNFQYNLEDILNVGLRHDAKILLNTVAVNLRDCPPFVSLVDSNLPPADAAAARDYQAKAYSAGTNGAFPQAVALYEAAVRLEPQSAQMQYDLGEAYLSVTNLPAALRAFEVSRDLDELPFRTTSALNEIIDKTARKLPDADLIFCDTAQLMARLSPAGIPGQELFYEHAHFNFDGNYALALYWATQMEPWLSAGGKPARPWASQVVCERMLALTDWNRAAVLEDMLRRLYQPPFTSQSNQRSRLDHLRFLLKNLRQRMDSAAANEARAVYASAIAADPLDNRLHENYAEFAEAANDLKTATTEWEKVRDLIPHHHLAYFQMGRLLVRQNRLPEGRAALQKALALRPDLAEGWLELGKVEAIEGHPEQALLDYERERRLVPDDYRVYYHMGRALSNLKRRSDAIVQLRRAIELKPDYWEGHYALGEELAFGGQVADARKAFEEVIRLEPRYAMAHFNLAVSLVALGERDAAVRQLEETVKLDPKNHLAEQYLEKIKSRQPPPP